MKLYKFIVLFGYLIFTDYCIAKDFKLGCFEQVVDNAQKDQSLRKIARKANKGDIKAIRRLGLYYNLKSNSNDRIKKAIACYDQMIALGDPRGIAHIAGIYANVHGEDFPRDLVKAEELYTEAVEQGVNFAYVGLGRLKQKQGDYTEAKRCYKEAALRGRPDAHAQIGNLHRYGLGRDVSFTKAEKFYLKSAKRGYKYAYQNLGIIYMDGNGEEFPQDYDEALYYLELAAEEALDPSILRLGKMYLKGLGVEKDIYKAEQYFLEAFELANYKAATQLGLLYSKNKDLYDISKAVLYFELAAEAGDVNASYHLGFLYLKGKQLASNLSKARELLTFASENGNKYAMYHLADMNLYGLGQSRDYNTAISLYEQSADNAYPLAALKLGKLYRYGQLYGPGFDKNFSYASGRFVQAEASPLIDINLDKAFELFELASQKQYPEALYELAIMHYQGEGTVIDLDKSETSFLAAISGDRALIKLENKVKNSEIRAEEWDLLIDTFCQ